jgi:putative transposase
LHLSKIGGGKIKLHRPIEGTIKTCTILVKNGHSYAVFSCEVEAVPWPLSQAMMGGDLGIKPLRVTPGPLPVESMLERYIVRANPRWENRSRVAARK